MEVSVGKRWESFVESVVADGSYGSADQVVVEGLRLVQEREAKLAALRETIQASIARGGGNTIDDVRRRLKFDLDTWEQDRTYCAASSLPMQPKAMYGRSVATSRMPSRL